MNNVPENELLSAYVDGELTAEEQAQVERLLAADPAARQLVDELRALSSSVKALPKHTIGRDISQQVVARAKRQMPTPAPAPSPEHEPPEDQAPAWRAIVRRVARPRNFLWSAVAVAVVVLLMVMTPDTLNGPHAPSVAMKSAADADEPSATPGSAPTMQAREEAIEILVEEEAAPAEMPASARPAGSVEFAERLGRGREAAETAARRAPSAITPSAAPGAAPPLAAKRPAEPSTGSAGYDCLGGAAGMGGPAGMADDRAKGQAPRVARRDVRDASKGPPSLAAKEAEASEMGAAADLAPAKAGQRRRRAAREPGLLMVVSCDVTPDAQHGNVFQELLARCQVSDAVTRVVSGRYTLGRIPSAEPAKPGAERLAMPDRPDVQAVAGKPLQVVDVEATAGQIKALLTELHDRPRQFASLSYTLDSGAVTRGLGRLMANGQTDAPRQAGDTLHEGAQTVGKPAGAGMAKQKLSRADVDRLFDMARRFQYGRRFGEEARPGATLGVEAQPVPSRPQEEGKRGTAVSQPAMDQSHGRAEPKLRASLLTPGAGPTRSREGETFGAAAQPAPPAAPAGPSPARAAQPDRSQASPPPERPQAERVREWGHFEEESGPSKNKAKADRFGTAPPTRKLEAEPATEAGLREAEEAQQMLPQEPAQAQLPALPQVLPEQDEPFDRDSGRYRVRFVLRVVGPPGGDVGASAAKDAPAKDAANIDVAGEAAQAAPEASPAEKNAPQAPAAKAPGAKP